MLEDTTNQLKSIQSIDGLAKAIYQEYYSTLIFRKTGNYPRSIKNWDKIKEKNIWPYILKFADTVKKSNGAIDYKLFVKALFEFTNGEWINPKLFTTQQGIGIYKVYLKKMENDINPESIKSGLIRSAKFVAKFCKAHNIKSFEDYLNHNSALFPSVLTHFQAGSITKPFFYLIPSIEHYLTGCYPVDIVYDMFGEKDIHMDIVTKRIFYSKKSEWIIKFDKNFESVINHLIEK